VAANHNLEVALVGELTTSPDDDSDAKSAETANASSSAVSDAQVGLCVFCDQTRQLADEDLFPLWSNKIMRDLSGGKVDVVLSERQVDVDGSTMGDVQHRRHQTYSAIKLPRICAVCNNGWMSRIENAAKRILEPMIRDTRSGILVHHQIVIARWMALKTLTADLIDHGYPTFDAEDYHAFCASPEPPPDFLGKLGRINLAGKTDQYFTLLPALTSVPLNGVIARTPLALEFSMSLGPVFFQSRYFNLRTARFPRPPIDPPNQWWTVVWPQEREVNWPPPRSFTPKMLPDSQGHWPEATEWIAQNIRRPNE
jgi:hypothetical protein